MPGQGAGGNGPVERETNLGTFLIDVYCPLSVINLWFDLSNKSMVQLAIQLYVHIQYSSLVYLEAGSKSNNRPSSIWNWWLSAVW